MKRSLSMMLVALAGLAANSSNAEPQFITLAGVPTAISADGSVVVGGNAGNFRWVRTGSTATYTVLNPNTAGLGAVACSSDGSVVVGSMVNPGIDFFPEGYAISGRWTAATGFVPQHAPSVFPGTGTPNTINFPRGCTRDGRYIVGVGYQSATAYRPMLLDTLTGVGVNPGGISASRAARLLCVNDDATVVAGDDDVTGSAQRPAVWRLGTNGLFQGTILEPGNGGSGSPTVNAMSADGSKLTGQSFFDNTKLVRWEYNAGTGAYTKVILATTVTPSGATLGRVNATAMTADGNTIFGSYNNGGRAFIWTAATGLRDLTTDLQSEGMTGAPSGTVIGNISGISANGRTFVGGGGFSGPGFVIYRDGGVGCVAPVETPVTSTTSVSMCSRTIIINGAATGTGPFTYAFRKDGVPISAGPTGNVDANGVASTYAIDSSFAPSQLRVNNAGPADAGTYDVIITNSCGSIVTSPRVVTAVPQGDYDTCETAQITSGSGPFPFEMCGAYVNQSPATCAGTQRADVWMQYTPLFTGDARISTCSGSNFDTILSVYNTCGGPEIACSNDFCNSRASIERIAVTAGVPILVRLGVGSSVPTAQILVTVDQLDPPPANDTCAGAIDFTTESSTSVNFDNSLAGNSQLVSCSPNAGKDVYYRFNATTSGRASFNTCGTLQDTILTVLDTCGGTELGCNDNANFTGCTFQSAVNDIAMQAGGSVIVRVAGKTISTAGAGFLNVTFVPGSNCPADFNGDGTLDPDDLADYIGAFFALPPASGSDFNGDGTTDPDDLADYIGAFFNGCP